MGCWRFGDGTRGENPDEERGSDFSLSSLPTVVEEGWKGLHPHGRKMKEITASPMPKNKRQLQLSSGKLDGFSPKAIGLWKLGVEAVADGVVMGSTEPPKSRQVTCGSMFAMSPSGSAPARDLPCTCTML